MIKLYSAPNCQQCKWTQRALDAKGIPYEVLHGPDHADDLKVQGFRQFPVVFNGDQSWEGYRPDILMNLEAT